MGFVLSAVVDGTYKSLNAAPYITQAELPATSPSTSCSALHKCACGVLLDPGAINSSLQEYIPDCGHGRPIMVKLL